jgi:hypothetical protein
MAGKVRVYQGSGIPPKGNAVTSRWKIFALAVVVIVVCTAALYVYGIPKNQKPAVVNYYAYGDSITGADTVGGDLAPDGSDSYISQMVQLYSPSSLADYNLDGGGADSTWGLANLPSHYRLSNNETYNPVYVIEFGVNDYDLDPDITAGNLISMRNFLTGNGTQSIILMPTLYYEEGSLNFTIENQTSRITVIQNLLDAGGVPYVKMYDALDSIPNNGALDGFNGTNYIPEGTTQIHPNKMGQRLMAEYLWNHRGLPPSPAPQPSPAVPVTPAGVQPIPVTPVVQNNPMNGTLSGQLNISVGTYNAILPVFIDGMVAGNVSSGRPLAINLSEGSHLVAVCTGTTCEQVSVHMGYGIRTSVDFEEFLKNDAPLGQLTVSIGRYPASLPVFIDEGNVGTVSPGKMLNQTLGTGTHSVKVCVDDVCLNQTAVINASARTFLDFEGQLKSDLPQGTLLVSIGGFNADLPVLIDNTTAGTVSLGKPLEVKVNQGNHSIVVCSGMVCENESVHIRFGRQSIIDFGDRLVRDVEFQKPTVKVLTSSLDGNALTVSVAFINPDNKDHTISATISCVYSFSDSDDKRRSDSAQNRVTRLVKAGQRVDQDVSLNLPGGSDVIANDPVVIDLAVV